MPKQTRQPKVEHEWICKKCGMKLWAYRGEKKLKERQHKEVCQGEKK